MSHIWLYRFTNTPTYVPDKDLITLAQQSTDEHDHTHKLTHTLTNLNQSSSLVLAACKTSAHIDRQTDMYTQKVSQMSALIVYLCISLTMSVPPPQPATQSMSWQSAHTHDGHPSIHPCVCVCTSRTACILCSGGSRNTRVSRRERKFNLHVDCAHARVCVCVRRSPPHPSAHSLTRSKRSPPSPSRPQDGCVSPPHPLTGSL